MQNCSLQEAFRQLLAWIWLKMVDFNTSSSFQEDSGEQLARIWLEMVDFITKSSLQGASGKVLARMWLKLNVRIDMKKGGNAAPRYQLETPKDFFKGIT